MKATEQKNSLCEILENQLIPRVRREGMNDILVAPPRWQVLQQALQQARRELPAGMTATYRALQGRRVPARGGRPYGAAAVIDASWPEDGLHAARTPKLCFILAGAVTFPVADYVLHCRPGHGVLLPSGTPFATGSHSFAEGTPGTCRMLQMMPYHGGLVCWISHRQEAGDRQQISEETCSVPQSRVPFFLHQLVEEAARHDLHQSLICDSLLNIVLALLCRELQQLPIIQTGDLSLAGNPISTTRKEYSIAQAQEYIHNNLREPLRIDKVARLVCMSRTAFTEQFRASTGKTFAQYVQDCRIAEARRLLTATDLAVRHIGSLVGLQPNRMRALFHEREGVSPTEFRRRARS